MGFKRTGEIQTEVTASGIITTAEEKGHYKGRKVTRWTQIGYTSIMIDNDGVKYIDGAYGQQLVS